MDTATRLLYTDRVSIDGLLTRRFPFDQAPAAYRWIDEHPGRGQGRPHLLAGPPPRLCRRPLATMVGLALVDRSSRG